MEFIPEWVLAASCSILALLAVIFLIASISTPTRRSLTILGIRYSIRSPGETVALTLPSAVLIGIIFASLSIGDGLYTMVENNTEANLSDVDMIVSIPDFIDENVWMRAEENTIVPIRGSAGIVDASGLISGSGGGRRIGARIIGADSGIFQVIPVIIDGETSDDLPGRYECLINGKASEDLGIETGGRIRIEVHPGDLVGTSLLDYNRDRIEILNLTVGSVIDNSGLGRFSEDSSSSIQPIVVLDRNMISDRLGREGMVNSILVDIEGAGPDDDLEDEMEDIRTALDTELLGEDAGFALSISDISGNIALKNADFFFEAGKLDLENMGHIRTSSYFVDVILSDSGSTFYPVVAGLDTDTGSGIRMTGTDGSQVIPAIGNDEIIINNFTAELLNVTYGDTVSMALRIVDDRGELVERTAEFRVASVVMIDGFGAERYYVPDIIGVTDAPTCSSWDDSFEVDTSSIGEEDTDYWEMYAATPKAYISYDSAVELWGTEYGGTTAIIFNSSGPDHDEITSLVDGSVSLSTIGGRTSAVKYQALQSSRGLLIFPGMFLTFGSVIMLGAVLSMVGIVRSVSLKRSRDWGILKGMGTSKWSLLHTGLSESAVSLASALLFGLMIGTVVSIMINIALGSIWSDAVEGSAVPMAFSLRSAAVSAGIGIGAAVLVLVPSILREAGKIPGPNVQKSDTTVGSGGKRTGFIITAVGIALALLGFMVLLAGRFIGSGIEMAGYFTLGSMLLSSGLALLIFVLIGRVSDRSDLLLMLTANLSRRPGKNPLVIGTLSLTLAVALSLTAVGEIMEQDVEDRFESYGGGFEYVVETEFPMEGSLDEINSMLDAGIQALPILSRGEEGGKCSNINAPFPPRLLGVPPDVGVNGSFGLMERDPSFDSDLDAWMGLSSDLNGRIPIFVDQNTLTWIYYEGLGSVFEIDGADGSTVKLQVAGILEPSVLTGTFVMSEDNLRSIYPRTSGYTYFLIEAGDTSSDESLEEAFDELGPRIMSTEDMARDNMEYERSYLYLFREFLVFGLMISMASAVSFSYARTLTMRKEMEILRSIGVRRGRNMMYISAEHGAIFGTASIGALIGTAVSLLIYANSIGIGSPQVGVFVASLFIALLVFLTGMGFGYLSSRIVVGNYTGYIRREQ